MTRYTSPVNPAVFPHLTVVLLAIGMFFTAWFFVYPSCHHLGETFPFPTKALRRKWTVSVLTLSVYALNPVCSSYEVTSTKYTRDVYKELLISLVASLFMGFGVLFLLLWVGIYVWRWGFSWSSLASCVLLRCVCSRSRRWLFHLYTNVHLEMLRKLVEYYSS